MNTPPLVIGLDLSIAATGVAYDDTTETWAMNASIGDDRLERIASNVANLVAKGCDLVVIEDLPTHAHGAGITGMVHGAVRTELIRRDVPYALVTPATLKKYATGKGNASKAEMAVALYKRAGLELGDDNQVDAYFLSAAGMHHLDHRIIDVPQAQCSALDKVTWPGLAAA